MKLSDVDLSASLSGKKYDAQKKQLGTRINELQRAMAAANLPTIVVFEGWDMAGKGLCINRLMESMDPRNFKVHPILAPTQDERWRPWLWRFWTKLPASGRVAIFDQSWYGRVLAERVAGAVDKPQWKAGYDQINTFERDLIDDNTVIVKFFLHIDRRTQARRFKQARRTPSERWKVTEGALRRHKEYKAFEHAIDQMLARTDKPGAPWHVVPAVDWQYAVIEVYKTVIAAWEKALKRRQATGKVTPPLKQPAFRGVSVEDSPLRKADLALRLDRADYNTRLDACQTRLRQLEHLCYMHRQGVAILFEGWDAAGKGGCIRRLTSNLDPRGYEVVPIGVPTDVERAHQYLWRFACAVPKAGHITVFDRSWYGRVLVERVEGFATDQQWQRAYGEISHFEDNLRSSGMVLVKFWLQIDRAEQLRRFKDREQTPAKSWKITPEDWRNRRRWPLYEQALADMFARTSSPSAPWTIVEANDKLYARIKVLRTVIDAIEAALPKKALRLLGE